MIIEYFRYISGWAEELGNSSYAFLNIIVLSLALYGIVNIIYKLITVLMRYGR